MTKSFVKNQQQQHRRRRRHKHEWYNHLASKANLSLSLCVCVCGCVKTTEKLQMHVKYVCLVPLLFLFLLRVHSYVNNAHFQMNCPFVFTFFYFTQHYLFKHVCLDINTDTLTHTHSGHWAYLCSGIVYRVAHRSYIGSAAFALFQIYKWFGLELQICVKLCIFIHCVSASSNEIVWKQKLGTAKCEIR